MKDSENLNNLTKFVKRPYHDNLDYLDYLEQCHSICNSIYIYRNFVLSEAKIIEQ